MNYQNMGSDPPMLTRQPSVYALTLDEFQNSLGVGLGLAKDVGSMNMDEFLKNIWTAEETQAMASSSAGLIRQGSLTLPRTLSQKTVDEVWRNFGDFQQPSLGEMTLEEFLVRAGVVREDVPVPVPVPVNPLPQPPIFTTANNIGNNRTNNSMFYSDVPLPAAGTNQGLTLGFGQPGRVNGPVIQNPVMNNSNNSTAASMAMTRVFPASELVGPKRMRGMMAMGDQGLGNVVMSDVVGMGGGISSAAVVSPASRIPDGMVKTNGDLSSLSPAPYVFGGGLRMKKNGVEKVVERRQKRMIKNRESAARSRARKQAYTMELEAEIAKLKEQHEDLQQKQVEIMEMQKNQVMEIINQPLVPKKRCLRRTNTGPW